VIACTGARRPQAPRLAPLPRRGQQPARLPLRSIVVLSTNQLRLVR
jgi:hypothetical protein